METLWYKWEPALRTSLLWGDSANHRTTWKTNSHQLGKSLHFPNTP